MTDDEIDSAIGISGAREMAERQFLATLNEDAGALEIRITRRDGTWMIRLDNPGDGLGEAFATGESFVEAWHRLAPAWAPRNDNGGGL